MAKAESLELAKVRDMIDDLDSLLGLGGNFWRSPKAASIALDTPEQLQELFSDLYVDLLGLAVEGL